MSSSKPEADVSVPGRRILVIDDEASIGLSCKRILGRHGHDVQSYDDPQTGLQAALIGDFDVLLVDLVMPEIDGLEILKHIKAAGVSSEVVIITGYSTVESAVEAMKHGAADYLSKPFSPSQLEMVLQKVCERSALIQENVLLRQELELRQGFEGIIGSAAERTTPCWRAIAARWRPLSSKANCLAMARGLSPVRLQPSRACSRRRTKEPSSWMRLPTSAWRYRGSC